MTASLSPTLAKKARAEYVTGDHVTTIGVSPYSSFETSRTPKAANG